MGHPEANLLNSMLRMAVLAGVESAVRMHVRRGDDLNARDANGFTPLMLAAWKNKGLICSLLLSSGADPFMTDPKGRNALAIATESDANDAILILKPFSPELIEKVQSIAETSQPILLADRADDLSDGTDFLIEISDWEAEVDDPVVLDSVDLFDTARAIHGAISVHIPIDNATDWDNLSTYLPEEAAPLEKLKDEAGRLLFIRLFRRALSEGSVPDRKLMELAESLDGERDVAEEALLRIVIGDLGAETDERIELDGADNHWEEDSFDEDEVISAMDFLEELHTGRNEPRWFYLNEMRGGKLLTAEEEVALGKEMLDSLSAAFDAITSWPTGVATLLSIYDTSDSSELAAEVIGEDVGDQGEDMGTDVLDSVYCPNVDIDNGESVEGHASFQSSKIAEQIHSMRILVDSVGLDSDQNQSLHEALQAVRIPSKYLARLARDSVKDVSEVAISFRKAINRYFSARERMTVSNLRLVISIVKRYQGHGLSLDDLIQEGNIGLMKAVERYDWRKGFRFSTYATWWIRQQATRALADQGKLIRTPAHVHEAALGVGREQEEIERVTGNIPSAEDLAKKLGMSPKKVSVLMAVMHEPESLYETDGWGVAPVDVLKDISLDADPFEQADRVLLTSAIDRLLATLADREAEIISFRFGLLGKDSLTLEEVGKVYSLTRERVRQIEAIALRKLANPTRSSIFACYFSESNSESGSEDSKFRKAPSIKDIKHPELRDKKSADVFLEDESQKCPSSQAVPDHEQTDRVISQLRAGGAEVVDERLTGGNILVRLGYSGANTRKLIRLLLDAGFEPETLGEYRK